MSLATSCPACGTVFRVIQDQLKVSEGWVRCGQCQEVFNALEGLFDLDRPPPGTGPLRRPTPDMPVPEPTPAPMAVAAPAPMEETPAPAPPPAPTQIPPSAEPLAPDPDPAAPASETPPAAAVSAVPPAAALEAEPAQVEPTPAEPAPMAAPADEAAEAGAPLPSFVVNAQREARWQRPLVRAGLLLLALCAALGLMLQTGWHHRDLLAARWAWTRPVLTSLCQWQGCTLQPPRLLDALLVDNTTLTRPPGVDAYRLQVTLLNRVEFPVRAPHLELSLNDANGALLVRRVLSPADFRRPTGLTTGESQWQLEFSSSERRFAGYTVAAFYP